MFSIFLLSLSLLGPSDTYAEGFPKSQQRTIQRLQKAYTNGKDAKVIALALKKKCPDRIAYPYLFELNAIWAIEQRFENAPSQQGLTYLLLARASQKTTVSKKLKRKLLSLGRVGELSLGILSHELPLSLFSMDEAKSYEQLLVASSRESIRQALGELVELGWRVSPVKGNEFDTPLEQKRLHTLLVEPFEQKGFTQIAVDIQRIQKER